VNACEGITLSSLVLPPMQTDGPGHRPGPFFCVVAAISHARILRMSGAFGGAAHSLNVCLAGHCIDSDKPV
jgi:hypothetical protein